MYQFILLIHVFIAVFVIALVLVQQGKGATMGAAFGSGASQTVFGSRGSGSFLFRVTITLALIFFITSVGLNYLATQAYKQAGIVSLPSLPVAPMPVKKTSETNTTTGETQPAPGEIPERK